MVNRFRLICRIASDGVTRERNDPGIFLEQPAPGDPGFMRNLLFGIAFSLIVVARGGPASAAPAERQESAAAPVAVQQVSLNGGVRDEVVMVLVGTALIALGAAVRRVV